MISMSLNAIVPDLTNHVSWSLRIQQKLTPVTATNMPWLDSNNDLYVQKTFVQMTVTDGPIDLTAFA